MASGIRDFNVSFGSRVAVLALALGTQSCLAWTLGTAGYGSYAVAMLFLVILSLIFMIGCETAGIGRANHMCFQEASIGAILCLP